MAELFTALTDVLLALQAGWYVHRLSRDGVALTRSTTLFFMGSALGAAGGAIEHGFGPQLGETAALWVWRFTLVSLGGSGTALLLAWTAAYLRGASALLVRALALLGLALFLLWGVPDGRFLWVLVLVAPGLLGLAATAALGTGHPAAKAPLLLGVALSLGAGGIQAAGIGLTSWIDHNGLFHLVQLLGMAALFRGMRRWHLPI